MRTNGILSVTALAFVFIIVNTMDVNASEISSEQTTDVVYAPIHPTNEEVEAATATDLVTFNDANLEQVLANELGVTVGEITVGDMETLTNLNMHNENISNLTGLEYATNLTILELYNNNISDVTPLSGLTNLTILSMFNNKISDIAPLSGLTNLTDLSLNGNEISDITTVSGLVNLTELQLTSNGFSDIAPLSGLTNLTILELYNNNISDVTPLSGLTNLTDLGLDRNVISDITPLSGLTELDYLILKNNQITDVTPLSKLTKLEYLSLEWNQITDVTPLSKLTNLDKLFLAFNQISDISPLSELKKITFSSLRKQSILLEDIVVNDSKEIFYTIIDIDGIEHQVSLGTPVEGTNEMTGDWSIDTIFGTDSYRFSGYIDQTVTYDIPSTLTGIGSASSTEETRLSDEQLVSLFEVVNSDGLAITVEQSSVDYSTPGDYDVIFTDTDGNEFTATLTIADVLPTLSIDKDTVSISIGSSVDDILSQLTLNATEITDGDLTGIISIDDSSVDYSTPGDYHVIFTVVDEEGNSVSKTVTITIIEENVETVDPKIPDGVEEVNSEETTSRMAEDETISNDENVQMRLLTTGDKIVGTIIALLTVVIIALVLKKYIRVK